MQETWKILLAYDKVEVWSSGVQNESEWLFAFVSSVADMFLKQVYSVRP